ncbi:hypothetical protein LC55x_0714 [Lysobacter capsici]|nr:hypothetical protein LC55x_0714 [Lysobacter capsici]
MCAVGGEGARGGLATVSFAIKTAIAAKLGAPGRQFRRMIGFTQRDLRGVIPAWAGRRGFIAVLL